MSAEIDDFNPLAAPEHPDFLSQQDHAAVADVAPALAQIPALLAAAAEQVRTSSAIDASAALSVDKYIEHANRLTEALMAEATRRTEAEFDAEIYKENTLDRAYTRHLKISASEAKRRRRMARETTATRTHSGATVPARFERIGTCLAEGTISVCQADTMIDVLNRIPPHLRAQHEAAAEGVLLHHSPQFDIEDIKDLGRRILGWIDPDGKLPQERTHPDQFHVTTKQMTNGDWRLNGLMPDYLGLMLNAALTNREYSPSELAEQFRRASESDDPTAALAALGHTDGSGESSGPAKPAPTALSDDRPDGARRLDRFEAILTRGTTDTNGRGGYALVVNTTAQEFTRGRGEVEAAGGTVDLERLLSLSPGGQIYYHATKKGTRDVKTRTEGRFATKDQLTILKARDRGCTFPECGIPAGWCDAHHIIPHRDGGPTTIENLTLLCRFHHAWHERNGWQCRMIDGLPDWIPPHLIDLRRAPMFHARFYADLYNPETLFSRADTLRPGWREQLPPEAEPAPPTPPPPRTGPGLNEEPADREAPPRHWSPPLTGWDGRPVHPTSSSGPTSTDGPTSTGSSTDSSDDAAGTPGDDARPPPDDSGDAGPAP